MKSSSQIQLLNPTQSIRTQYNSDDESNNSYAVNEIEASITSRGRKPRGTPRATTRGRGRGKRQTTLNF